MANVNTCIFIGNLTRDPELAYLPNQTAVVNFGLAINRKWKSADGEAKEEVCFIDCQCFAKSAEILTKYVKKGDPIYIEGRLKFEMWSAKDGTKHSKHRLIIEKFQFLSTKKHTDTPGTTAAEDQAPAENQPPIDEPPF